MGTPGPVLGFSKVERLPADLTFTHSLMCVCPSSHSSIHKLHLKLPNFLASPFVCCLSYHQPTWWRPQEASQAIGCFLCHCRWPDRPQRPGEEGPAQGTNSFAHLTHSDFVPDTAFGIGGTAVNMPDEAPVCMRLVSAREKVTTKPINQVVRY